MLSIATREVLPSGAYLASWASGIDDNSEDDSEDGTEGDKFSGFHLGFSFPWKEP